MKVIILAAGIGSRLGNPYPKALSKINSVDTILNHQLKNIEKYLNLNSVIIVVGFKKELIMEAFPELLYVYNNYYDRTNTAQSFLMAMKKIENEDVLWLNGDVVFDAEIIGRLIENEYSCMAVNKVNVGKEEVKYLTDQNGLITKVSKNVQNAIGEALGINLIKARDLYLLKRGLSQCNNNDYFERGIEFAINQGLKIYAMDIGDLHCIEIDFKRDLKKAESYFKT